MLRQLFFCTVCMAEVKIDSQMVDPPLPREWVVVRHAEGYVEHWCAGCYKRAEDHLREQVVA